LDVKDALYGPAGAPDGANPMGSLLGATLGESPAEAQARIEEVKKTANDLTGLVRRKKTAKTTDAATPEANAAGGSDTNGKRKAEDGAEESDGAKKAKVKDAPEE
jgi:HAT1-interacting factor 1